MRRAIWPREVAFFEAYLDWADTDEADALRESGNSSDFLTYASAVVTKRVMRTYNETPFAWPRYTQDYNVPDFKPISFVGLTEGEDLLEFVEDSEYKDSKIRERVGPTLSVQTFGRLFSITRKALINDDLGMLRDAPARLGRSAGRTLNRSVVRRLESPGNAYDGTATFHTNHGNLITDPLSETGLGNAALKLNQQTDDNGNPIVLTAALLLIPPALEITARRILNSTNVIAADQLNTNPTTFIGNTNVMSGYVPYAVERYLTDPNDWYLIGNTDEAPVIAVGFLNGRREPQTMLRDPGMRLVLGGSDPYSMEFDEMVWKIRHEWGTGIMDWRGIVKAAVP